jgi:hypothetical protein
MNNAMSFSDMNKLNFTEIVQHGENQTANFLVRGSANSTNSQEVVQLCSNSCMIRFSCQSPVLFGHNYKPSTFTSTSTPSRSAENIKEFWSAEELTVNLVNRTTMRIANLKHKLDEQLNNIKLLQGNQGNYRDSPEPINEQNSAKSHFGSSNKNGEKLTVDSVRKEKNVNPSRKVNKAEATKTSVGKPSVPHRKRKKRLRRGTQLKEFFYHPLVVDCSASVPEELTKEEFLRQLRLIPTCRPISPHKTTPW